MKSMFFSKLGLFAGLVVAGLLAGCGPDAGSPAFVDVFTASSFACALDDRGEVQCWGDAEGVELVESAVADTDVQRLSLRLLNGCAEESGGAGATCWSAGNLHGEANPPDVPVSHVVAGNFFACGLDQSGSATCWGRETPGYIDPPSGTFVDLAAGPDGVCARDTAGSLHCWGGGNSRFLASVPSGSFEAVVVSDLAACALATDGSVTCWGENVGVVPGTPADRLARLSVASTHACGVDLDGAVVCWGGTFTPTPVPPAEADLDKISSSSNYSCGVTTAGAVTCWGNEYASEDVLLGPQ